MLSYSYKITAILASRLNFTFRTSSDLISDDLMPALSEILVQREHGMDD
jgi:hypothetical protein